MKLELPKLLVTLGVLLQASGSFADINLLDQLKAKRQRYSLGSSCQSFIQKANHNTLKSQDIKNATVPLSSMGYVSNYFFHYSPDEGKELRNAVSKQDFTPIVDFLFLYSGALENYFGVGLYVAANPYSSSTYGSWQFFMKIDSKARMFNSVANGRVLDKVLKEKIAVNPDFYYCPTKLAYNLILDENDVDISHYESSDARQEEWSIILNEDIIQKSEASYVGSSSNREITSRLMNSNPQALLGFAKEINPNRYYSMELQSMLSLVNGSGTDDKIIKLASEVKDWNEDIARVFAALVSTTVQPSLNRLITNFQAKISSDTYYEVDFSVASPDFINYIGQRIKSSPTVTKKWDDNLFGKNMVAMVKNGAIEVDDVTRYSGSSKQIAEMVKKRSSLSAPQQVRLIDVFLDKYTSTFDALSSDDQFAIFNNYLTASQSDDQIPRFISLLGRSKYNMKLSFDYILRKPSSYPNAASAAFMQHYILQTRDPSLLNDSSISFILSRPAPSLASFVQTVIMNRALYGAGAEKLIRSALTKADLPRKVTDVLYDPTLFASYINPQLARTILAEISSKDTSFSTYDRLLQEKNFLSQLDQSSFESFIKNALRFNEDLNLSTLFNSGLMNFERSMVLFTYLNPKHGEGNIVTLNKEFLVFDEMSENNKKIFFSRYVSNNQINEFNRNLYSKSIATYAIEKKRVGDLVSGQAAMSSQEKLQLITYYLESNERYKEGAQIFREAGNSFEVLVLRNNDGAQITTLMSYLEASYPATTQLDYVSEMVKNYPYLRRIPAAKTHMEKFLCKNVNKYKAYGTLIDSTENSDKKKELKLKAKTYCPESGFFDL